MPRRRTTRTLRSRDAHSHVALSWLSSSCFINLLDTTALDLVVVVASTAIVSPHRFSHSNLLLLLLLNDPQDISLALSHFSSCYYYCSLLICSSSRRLSHLGCSCKRSPTVPPPPKPKQFVQCIKASNCSVAFLHSFRCSLSLTPLSLSHHGSYLRSPRPSISHSWLLATPRHVSISPPANHATTIAQQPQQPPPPTASAVERR